MSLQQDPDLIFLLNRLVYWLPTGMSSVTENHIMDLFYLLKENFKNPLFDSLITLRTLDNLSYVSRFVSQYILRSGSLWHPLSSSILRNRLLICSNKMCEKQGWKNDILCKDTGHFLVSLLKR